MSKIENPASGGTLDGANSNIAGRDSGIKDAALELAATFHFYVFPVPVGTKKSHKAAAHSGGIKWGATNNPEQIAKDFDKWPNANLGVATGPESGIFVLDVDTIAGHGVDGVTSLMELVEANGPLPDTLRAQSPSGSCHFYFNYPVGIELRKSESKLGDGLDVQGMLAIVIAPPSIKGTRSYRWQNAGTPIADAPDWLIEKCIEVEINEAELTLSERALAAMGSRTEFAPGSREEKRVATWLSNAFDDEVKLVASTRSGRNPQLYKSVMNIAGYMVNGAPGIHAADIRDRFFEAMVVNGSIKDNGKSATLNTIKSALGGNITPRLWPDFSDPTNGPPANTVGEAESTGSEYQDDGTHESSLVTDMTDRRPPPQPPAPLNSEMDLANSFVSKHEAALRYVAEWGSWMIWDGKRWACDHTLRAFDLARLICRDAARKCNEESEAKSLAAAKTVAAVERMAKAYRVISATVDQWDASPLLLNDHNATIDLRTGYARTPDRTNYLTKIAGCHSAPQGTKHPIWTQFLNRITGDDAELVRFLQRYLGYCLTGEVKEHVFVFAYGTGANGKGVYLNTMSKVFGEYAVVADMGTFIESKNDRHPTDVAKLCGSRLVVAQETQQGRQWDEAKIKAITGGDKQTARFMRQDFFDFFPTFKLFIVGNHKPTLKNVDEAMKRRLLLVPFTVQIPLVERDPTLSDRLEAEWPAILRWAIDGCLEWKRIGLKPPKVVTDATAEYFAAEDGFGLWLDDACDLEPGNKWKKAAFADLFTSWTSYATGAGIEPGTSKAFKELLLNRGAEPTRIGKDRDRGYEGIMLKPRDAFTEAADAAAAADAAKPPKATIF